MEGNTTSEFRAQLPHPIELQGQWQVGLAELQYPSTYNTIRNCSLTFFAVGGSTQSVKIPDGHYVNIAELINAINFAVFARLNGWLRELKQNMSTKLTMAHEVGHLTGAVDGIRDAITFEYVDVLKKVRVKMNKGYMDRIELDKRLQHTLGFTGPIKDTDNLAEYPVDIRAGMDSMFLYCSLIAPQLVGDIRTNLLKVVPLRGVPGEIVSLDFPTVHYADLLTNRFSAVDISIKGSDGELIHFNFGKIYVKLHLRKKRLF